MKELKFVIVDDAIFMRALLKRMIEEVTEYKVVGEAENGYEAIEKVKQFQPDIVTLDITMPDMDGLRALKEIKIVSPRTEVIMVSAMGQQSMMINAIRNGAKDFIVKPFEQERVLEAIKNAVAQ